MGFNVQQGHKTNTSADAGDVLNVNPVSVAQGGGQGGIMMGNIGTGDKTQTPQSYTGGSQATSNFDFKIPAMGGQGGAGGAGGAGGMPEIKMPEIKMPTVALMNLNMYAQPQYNQVLLI